jgi:membrane associated rhomboid family serine protease
MGITEEFKQSFLRGTSLIKLIYINIIVFVVIKIFVVIDFLFNSPGFSALSIVYWLSVPAEISQLISRPWSVFTYMFLHSEFMHILFNMLWLYWFGKIFLEYLSQKKLLTVYILGGVSGAFFYILSYNIFPVFYPVIGKSIALGASASVIAIVTAISFYVPNYTINILFLGQVKLKYIALFSILLDLISISTENPGGHIAHLGGAVFGILYIEQYRKGKDITRWFDRLMDNIASMFKPGKKSTAFNSRRASDMDYNRYKAKKQEEINTILDKISKSGYDSLTRDEKDKLFKMSNEK